MKIIKSLLIAISSWSSRFNIEKSKRNSLINYLIYSYQIFKKVPAGGFDPPASRLWDSRSNQLSYTGQLLLILQNYIYLVPAIIIRTYLKLTHNHHPSPRYKVKYTKNWKISHSKFLLLFASSLRLFYMQKNRASSPRSLTFKFFDYFPIFILDTFCQGYQNSSLL